MALNLGKVDELHCRTVLLHDTAAIGDKNAYRGAAEGPAVCREGAGGGVIQYQ